MTRTAQAIVGIHWTEYLVSSWTFLLNITLTCQMVSVGVVSLQCMYESVNIKYGKESVFPRHWRGDCTYHSYSVTAETQRLENVKEQCFPLPHYLGLVARTKVPLSAAPNHKLLQWMSDCGCAGQLTDVNVFTSFHSFSMRSGICFFFSQTPFRMCHIEHGWPRLDIHTSLLVNGWNARFLQYTAIYQNS